MRTVNNSSPSLSGSSPLRPCCCHVAEVPINNRHRPHRANQKSRAGDMDSGTFLSTANCPHSDTEPLARLLLPAARGDKEAREKGGHWSQLILPIKLPKPPSCSQSPLGTHHSPAQPSTFLHLSHSSSHPPTSPHIRNTVSTARTALLGLRQRQGACISPSSPHLSSPAWAPSRGRMKKPTHSTVGFLLGLRHPGAQRGVQPAHSMWGEENQYRGQESSNIHPLSPHQSGCLTPYTSMTPCASCHDPQPPLVTGAIS